MSTPASFFFRSLAASYVARPAVLICWVVGASTLAPIRASAENAPPAAAAVPEQVELRYVGGPGCPNKAAFVHELAARIRRPIEWVLSSGTTQVVVTVGEADGHATGQLEIQRPATEPTRREFVAGSCSEVSSALALVTALALDPNARTELLPPPASGFETSEGAPPGGRSPPAPEAPAAAPAPPPSAATAPSPSVTTVAPAPAPVARAATDAASAPARYTVWLGPTAGAGGGYAPEPLVTLGVSLGVRAAQRRGFSPSFQLTPLWGKTGSTGPSASRGVFSWAMARLEACPTQLQISSMWTLEACLAGELGRLSARGAGSEIEAALTADRWWAAAGASIALHFSLGRWFTRLGTHVLFPITRDEFVFSEPDRTVHQAGVVVYGAHLGLGFEFGQ